MSATRAAAERLSVLVCAACVLFAAVPTRAAPTECAYTFTTYNTASPGTKPTFVDPPTWATFIPRPVTLTTNSTVIDFPWSVHCGSPTTVACRLRAREALR